LNGYQLTKQNADALWAKVAENRKTLSGLVVEVRFRDGLPSGPEEIALAAELERLVLEEAPLVGDARKVFGSGEFDLEFVLAKACANLGLPTGLHRASIRLGNQQLSAP